MNQLDGQVNLETLLEFLNRTRGFDFSAYKLSSLQRRIWKRMKLVNIEHVEDYIDFLEVHPDEFSALFNTILINVTSFFRDRPVWDYVASDILPRIASTKQPGEPIRVWSAGCASGEEAYSIAMLLAEQLGLIEFSRRVKIYATDVDEEALTQARQASYAALAVQDIPPALQEKYFEQQGDRCLVKRDLRRSVIFGRNDLIQDAPISRIDLLICRNTLMYLTAETQGRILARFNFALNSTGCLFLGKAEALLTQASLFTPVDLKCRVFSKILKPFSYENGPFGVSATLDESLHNSAEQRRLRDLALEYDPLAQLIVDHTGLLVMANEAACQLFNLAPSDVGRPYMHLDLALHPPDLASLLEQARFERRPRIVKEVEWEVTNLSERRFMDIALIPLVDGDQVPGFKIVYYDVTRQKHLQDELQHYNRIMGAANEELQSSNEELETTNEELQSAVEELETTNEELQSTNEEMETMNEELQAINEELEAANEALRQRSEELNHLNAFLNAILSSLREGVVVVDREFQVMAWNNHSQEMWGLRPEEVQGKNFLNLDFGLPVETLKPIVRGILAGNLETQESTVAAVNRRGKPIQVTMTCVPFQGTDMVVRGVILVMQDTGASALSRDEKDQEAPGAS